MVPRINIDGRWDESRRGGEKSCNLKRTARTILPAGVLNGFTVLKREFCFLFHSFQSFAVISTLDISEDSIII